MRTIRISIPVLFAMIPLSREPPPPEWVWVPSSDFEASLYISAGDAPGTVHRVEKWIVLHAERSTGPWIKVRHHDLPEKARWMRSSPPAREEGIEGNVRWFVEPEGSHTFNIPTPAEITARKLRFTQPREYRVWAESSDWAGGSVKSNVLEITITEQSALREDPLQ